ACDGRTFAIETARIAAANRCEDVAVLDLRGLSPLADFFVLGTGSSARQMHATLDRLREYARTVDRAAFRIADTSDAVWILADYVDVVVHLFDAAHREYYDLDGLWDEAPRIDWTEPGEGADS
ncbi:MAG: ribosome silencing factor, partial [Planctomycetota bacterium]